jgi:hypothetical protein
MLWYGDFTSQGNIGVPSCVIRYFSKAVQQNEATYACTDIEEYGGEPDDIEGHEGS